MSDKSKIPDTVRTVLASMKVGEVITCMVQPAHFLHYDKDLRGRAKEEGGYPDIDEDKLLYIDLELKNVNSIIDVYQDGSTISRVVHKIKKGTELFSTASPFSDSRIALRLKLQFGDDEAVFDNLAEEKEVIWYDMDYYQVPAALRRVLKLSKLHEIVEFVSSKVLKMIDFLPDTQNQIFDISKIKEALDGGKKVKVTFKLLEIQYKSNPSKLKIEERFERLKEIIVVSRAFLQRALAVKSKPENEVTAIEKQIQLVDYKKVEKLCLRIERFFKPKEQASQFEEEDETSEEFLRCANQIYDLHLENFQMHAKVL